MATLSFTANDEPDELCEHRACTRNGTVRVSQEHMDDGESWTRCERHALMIAIESMHWVATDGEHE